MIHHHELQAAPSVARMRAAAVAWRSEPDEETLILVDGIDATLVVLGTARECAACHLNASIFVNRSGNTRCLRCDGAPELR